ncbi:MAG: response regulator [Elusimicrobia bacterium]|nr:response regulator [Candidatus Obscuribacterium magneticum]
MGLFEKSKKILIVEDEPDIAESLKARLRIEKYEVSIAANGQAGVEKARAEKPDLVILDVMLPDIDGYEVCRVLKSEKDTRSIPVLVLTALPHIKDADRAFEVGANDFLNKPYTNERLLAKVNKLLAPQ